MQMLLDGIDTIEQAKRQSAAEAAGRAPAALAAAGEVESRKPEPFRRKLLRLCALCGLLVEDPPYVLTWVSGAWHPECLGAWTTFSGQRRQQFSAQQRPFNLPPPPPRMGRPIVQDKLWERLGAFLRYRAHGLGYPGGASLSALAQRMDVSKQTLSEQLAGLPSVLPGDWRRVFRQLKPGAECSLQKLFQLPEQLLPLVEVGERDDLVRWLHRYRMAPAQIARVTGVPVAGIIRVVPDRKAPEPAAG
jgi:hypothetical protein